MAENRDVSYYFVQANADNGYFLYPHQSLSEDSLKLPPYCQTNGHPTVTPVKWERLSEYARTFKTGDGAILYQSGNPSWLRGVWGYGTIYRRGDSVRIASKKLLATPLVVTKLTRKIIKTRFFKKLLDKKKGFAIRSTYSAISKEEFESLKELIKARDSTVPNKFRYINLEPIRATTAKRAFQRWASSKGWEVLSYGYPDLLASVPNGRIVAFEAKSGNDKVRESQRRIHNILKKCGLDITILPNVRNTEAEKEIKRNQWSVIAQGSSTTRGWPDYLLVKGKKVVGCELKTGWRETVSEMQVKTLSALSTFKDMEVHLIRAIKENEGWVLYDDTERWLLYPA